MTSRPTFFLSSTIYDFRDLRGAIKYHLESLGCLVLGSEFNDFHGDLDRHSYEACFANIDRSDHFLLLVGGRVGGWYDHSNRISITRQEYRHAYERHRAGSLRIVLLVRDEIWNLREDREALARHLETLKLTEEEKQAVAAFPSRFSADASFVTDFLKEIGRNAETERAVKEGLPKPTGNWIHVFRDFRDIADVLTPLTFGGLTADEAAYRKALQHELIETIRPLLLKHKGQALDPRPWLRQHFETYGVTCEQRDGRLELDGPDFDRFSTILYNAMGIRNIDMVVIADALTSSLFLRFDAATGAYVQTDAYRGLALLVDEIRLFNRLNTIETMDIVVKTSPKSRGGKDVNVVVTAQEMALLHSFALRWINIISLCRALILHLEGHAFDMPMLMPFSPVKGLNDAIDAEKVSAADARRWIEI